MTPPELHSIVVPFYNEEDVAAEFFSRLAEALSQLPNIEIIAIDDGSTDGTYELLAEQAARDPRVRVVRFSRNFGHQAAITAGLDVAGGDTVTVIDADLQDPPSVIPTMIGEWRKGADVVFAVRASRSGDSRFKRSSARSFYRMLHGVADVDVPADSGDFRLMSRRAVLALREMREQNRYVRGMAGWVGMRRAYVTYDRDARHAGETKYPLGRMVRLGLDAVLSFSTRPLRLAIWLGLAASVVGFLLALHAIYLKLHGDPVVPGWSSLIVTVLFMGGIQLLTIGVIGEYIGRIYDEVRARPLYLVADSIGFRGELAEQMERSPVPPIAAPTEGAGSAEPAENPGRVAGAPGRAEQLLPDEDVVAVSAVDDLGAG